MGSDVRAHSPTTFLHFTSDDEWRSANAEDDILCDPSACWWLEDSRSWCWTLSQETKAQIMLLHQHCVSLLQHSDLLDSMILSKLSVQPQYHLQHCKTRSRTTHWSMERRR
ncbi:hypothetical protein DPMN_190225 [Dreissena polymorpha]|uniref:Uncharacterized protein n=1 Tax=Dreissena polymorpha TaxID=45954 RepID=A0A9D4IBR9_DREPO|nr:hypothetical protein DPMN_190225 [Dreissena polymorpha]